MGDALFFEQCDHALGKGILAGSVKSRNVLVDDLQANRCVGLRCRIDARLAIQSVFSTKS